MSDDKHYVYTSELERRRMYASAALTGIVIGAIITGSKKFQEPTHIAGAAFELASAMMEREDALEERTEQ